MDLAGEGSCSEALRSNAGFPGLGLFLPGPGLSAPWMVSHFVLFYRGRSRGPQK